MQETHFQTLGNVNLFQYWATDPVVTVSYSFTFDRYTFKGFKNQHEFIRTGIEDANIVKLSNFLVASMGRTTNHSICIDSRGGFKFEVC
jgi:phage major head subunit gpT-like protein